MNQSINICIFQVETHDRKSGRTSGLRMFTQWIVGTTMDRKDAIATAGSYFDNVVVLIEHPEFIAYNDSMHLEVGYYIFRTV